MTGTLELWFYPRDRGTCRGEHCRAPIIWRRTTDDKPIPFNTNPEPIERREGSGGRLIEIVSTEDMHHRTCPDVGRFKRETKTAAAPSLPLE